MGAKLLMVGMPAGDPDALQDFYTSVLDYDFAPSLSEDNSWHAIASADGIDMLLGPRHHDSERAMPYFAVDDLDEALAQAEQAGGTAVWGPDEVTVPDEPLREYRKLHARERGPGTVTNTAGRAAIVQDPEGNLVGLVDPAEHTHEHFQVGRFSRALSAKQLRVHREDIRIGKKWKRSKGQ